VKTPNFGSEIPTFGSETPKFGSEIPKFGSETPKICTLHICGTRFSAKKKNYK